MLEGEQPVFTGTHCYPAGEDQMAAQRAVAPVALPPACLTRPQDESCMHASRNACTSSLLLYCMPLGAMLPA